MPAAAQLASRPQVPRSNKATLAPPRAKRHAHDRPITPPPIIAISHFKDSFTSLATIWSIEGWRPYSRPRRIYQFYECDYYLRGAALNFYEKNLARG